MTLEHFEYLNDLRDSGSINMMGAHLVLMDEFGLTRHEARAIVLTWIDTFKDDED